MAPKKKQRVKRKEAQHTNSSNRQSYDRDAPTDIHTRPIDYLTETEVRTLIEGAKQSRNPERNTLLIFMLFRHGLRESEALLLRRDWINFNNATTWIERLKRGKSSYHPIAGDELRLLRRYLRTRKDDLPWLFITERMEQMGARNVRALVAQAAKKAGMKHVKPHALRHACGYHLHNKGYDARLIQDYLGHVNPASTALYTRTAAKQFEGLW